MPASQDMVIFVLTTTRVTTCMCARDKNETRDYDKQKMKLDNRTSNHESVLYSG